MDGAAVVEVTGQKLERRQIPAHSTFEPYETSAGTGSSRRICAGGKRFAFAATFPRRRPRFLGIDGLHTSLSHLKSCRLADQMITRCCIRSCGAKRPADCAIAVNPAG